MELAEATEARRRVNFHSVEVPQTGREIEVSFVIPAHDEEALIGQAIVAIRESARGAGVGRYEIIVVDDASSDGTGEIARSLGAEVISVNHRQIAATRNSGARAARGKVLVFVDADTQVRADALGAALRVMRRGFVGGGACVEIERPLPLYGIVMERMLQVFAPAAGLAGGCFFFCRREVFETVGGFDPRFFAAEEVALARALSRRGRFIVLRETVLTSGRKLRAHSAMDIVRMCLRIARAGPTALHRREGLEFWYAPRAGDSKLIALARRRGTGR